MPPVATSVHDPVGASFAATVSTPPIALPPPQAAVLPPPEALAPTAFALATAAYASLARHDRRSAARDFAAAIAAGPDAANAPHWRADARALERRWSGEASVVVRGNGVPGFGVAGLGVVPLLGGGQASAALAWTPDPLAPRPLALTARATIAQRRAAFGLAGYDRDSAQAALGVRWQPVRGAALAVERLIAAGDGARAAWTLRASGGATRRFGPLAADAYAEAGVVGARRRDLYASLQARAVVPVARGAIGVSPGVGLWSAIQDAGATVDRVDVGPTVAARAGPVAATLDYRIRVAGNAAPGSGPVLTLAASF